MAQKVNIRSEIVLERQPVKRALIDGRYRNEPAGPKEQSNFEVVIDVDALIGSHGLKAMAAKRNFSQLANGAIKIIALPRKPEHHLSTARRIG